MRRALAVLLCAGLVSCGGAAPGSTEAAASDIEEGGGAGGLPMAFNLAIGEAI